MTGLKIIISLSVVMAMTNIITTDQESGNISPDCIECLCKGATGCNMSAGCQSTYQGANFCGPFHISWQYWLDAGSPTIRGADEPSYENFQDCTSEPFCSVRTVKKYLHKFIISKGVDCNKDGVIDCIDFALTQKLGGYNCDQEDNRPTKYYDRFYKCWNNTIETVKRLFIHPDRQSLP
ncbi:lysozyme-like [Macrobrachium rosenbergii]|uniref:lysozyme-like n=1 Tax=Macrobrachium rosenbergii TaxID=79674 RepID=UPI0034D5078E